MENNNNDNDNDNNDNNNHKSEILRPKKILVLII